jgi:hypothetical protein
VRLLDDFGFTGPDVPADSRRAELERHAAVIREAGIVS